MQLNLKSIAVVLLMLTIIPVSVVGQVLTPAAALAAPAGCHEHSQHAPVSQPVSYVCCEVGHNSAILQKSVVSQSLSLQSSAFGVVMEVVIPVHLNSGSDFLSVPSSGPASLIPLRV